MATINQSSLTQWQDGSKILLACWLLSAPDLFMYKHDLLAAWNGYSVAAIFALFSMSAIVSFAAWEEWITIAAGLWLIASPWLLGYSPTTPAVWNHVVIGMLAVVLSIWELTAAKRSR